MTTPPTATLTAFFNPSAQEHFTDPSTTLAVLHDLFPSEVTFTADTANHPGALPVPSAVQLPKCRTLITPDAVYVFIDGPRGPVLAFYDTIATDSLSGDRRAGFTLTPATADAHNVSTITVAPTNRCGCGSRLRGYRPFGRISYIPST